MISSGCSELKCRETSADENSDEEEDGCTAKSEVSILSDNCRSSDKRESSMFKKFGKPKKTLNKECMSEDKDHCNVEDSEKKDDCQNLKPKVSKSKRPMSRRDLSRRSAAPSSNEYATICRKRYHESVVRYNEQFKS